jgi:hypothetical protein
VNEKSVVLILAGLLALFSGGLALTHNAQSADTFGKLAFGTLTALAAYLQNDRKP